MIIFGSAGVTIGADGVTIGAGAVSTDPPNGVPDGSAAEPACASLVDLFADAMPGLLRSALCRDDEVSAGAGARVMRGDCRGSRCRSVDVLAGGD